MRRMNPFLAGMLFLCLTLGLGGMGCGDDEGDTVTVDLAQLCAESFQAIDSQGCRDSAYASVDDLKECMVTCGPADEECLEENCFSAPGSGFSGCTGDVEFLFSGQCRDCAECGLDFVGDESAPGCLFDPNPARTGEQCLDELYDCIDRC